MNCSELISDLGFSCKRLSEDTLRLWSPFTYGNDGEVIALYVEKLNHGYRITDNAEALMHASAMGVNVNKRRIEAVRKVSGSDVTISDGGVISALADEDALKEKVAAVLNASLAVSHFEIQWAPRIKSETFSTEVENALLPIVGERLKKNIVVRGASGHQIEIPFSIENGSETTYIQPVAYGDDRVDWDYVYRGFGKMTDLKNVGATEESRIVVLDDRSNDSELAKAINFLSISSTVINYSKLSKWAQKFAA